MGAKFLWHADGYEGENPSVDDIGTALSHLGPVGVYCTESYSKFGSASGRCSHTSVVTAPADNWVSPTADFTIAFWFRLDTIEESVLLAIGQGEGYANTNTVAIYVDSNSNLACDLWDGYGSGYSTSSPPGYLVANQWLFVAFCRHGTELWATFGSNVEGYDYGSLSVNPNPQPLVIGGRKVSGSPAYGFSGYIDEVFIDNTTSLFHTYSPTIPTAPWAVTVGKTGVTTGIPPSVQFGTPYAKFAQTGVVQAWPVTSRFGTPSLNAHVYGQATGIASTQFGAAAATQNLICQQSPYSQTTRFGAAYGYVPGAVVSGSATGIKSTAFGTPNAAFAQSGTVSAYTISTAFGTPTTTNTQTCVVDPYTISTAFGTPSKVLYGVTGDVSAFRSTVFGLPVALKQLTGVASALGPTSRVGTPKRKPIPATIGYAASIASTRIGDPTRYLIPQVESYVASTVFGTPSAITSKMTVTASGFRSTVFGLPNGVASMRAAASPVASTRFGTPFAKTNMLCRANGIRSTLFGDAYCRTGSISFDHDQVFVFSRSKKVFVLTDSP